MAIEQFRASISETVPPNLPMPLLALWYDAKGDWNAAHEAAQSDATAAGAWVHAYLHRKEGDISNAGYWYRRAGKTPASGSLEEEWEQIVAALLAA